MRRRAFLQAACGAVACRSAWAGAGEARGGVRALTTGPKHHFFGYYGICPWDADEKRLLCLESAFQDRMPRPGETAAIGLVDAENGAFTPVAETRAWNFQQGAMLHWHPLYADDTIIFNDVRKGKLVSVVLNIETGLERVLPRAVSGLGHAGSWAVSVTYGRLGRLRKVVGYAGAVDPYPDDPHPDKDGVFAVNIDTGETRLIVSIAQAYEWLEARGRDLGGSHLWFNHTVINRDDTRLLFLARTRPKAGGLQTGMFTVGMDGSSLREVIAYGKRVSHFDWRDGRQIVATCEAVDAGSCTHVLVTDGKDDLRVLGDGQLDFNGHCTFSPNGERIATDRHHTKAVENELLVYHLERDELLSLGRFDMRKRRYQRGDLRCDLHPRWNRTGNAVCFDCLEPKRGTRQLFVAAFP